MTLILYGFANQMEVYHMRVLERTVKTEQTAMMLVPRIIVGSIFLSEGIQKYLFPELVGVGRFVKIGFSDPEFWAYFVATCEIVCGAFVVAGSLTRLVSIPLLVIMATAFITTKYPVFVAEGFWPMAHAMRTDFAMTMLLLMTMYFGAGDYSIDILWYERLKK